MQALLLSMVLASAPASAGVWADFAALFPELPCHDGWAGCVVDGEVVGPDMVEGAEGVPMPAAMRLDWFTLQGTSTVSPFACFHLMGCACMGCSKTSAPSVTSALKRIPAPVTASIAIPFS